MLTRRDFLKVTAAGGALASFGNVAEAGSKIKEVTKTPTWCTEQERDIPVIGETDIVVVGKKMSKKMHLKKLKG